MAHTSPEFNDLINPGNRHSQNLENKTLFCCICSAPLHADFTRVSWQDERNGAFFERSQ